jgi:Flp pilus assembly protein TadG
MMAMKSSPNTPTRGAVRARARRRSERGAALVEALVALPFFIIVFALTMFVGKFYGDKMKTMRQSREAAWAGATVGCSGGAGSPLEEAATADLGEAAGAPGTEIFSKGFGNSSASMTAQVNASNVIGGWGVPIKSTTIVACNEKRQETNLLNVASYIFKLFI